MPLRAFGDSDKPIPPVCWRQALPQVLMPLRAFGDSDRGGSAGKWAISRAGLNALTGIW